MVQTIVNCPLGFRLVPTDEVAVAWYLKQKNDGLPHCNFIRECNICSHLPWKLPRDQQYGKRNELYFFVRADGAKSRRVGPVMDAKNYYYWRATGPTKTIKIKETTAKKMNLVLYRKRGSEKIKTNWMMHEYRLVNPSSSTGHVSQRKKGFVFCRIYRNVSSDEKNATKGNKGKKIPASTDFSMSNEDPSPVEIPSKSRTSSPDSPGFSCNEYLAGSQPEIPSDPAVAIQDSSGFSWRVEDLEAFLGVSSNAAPAAGSSDFHSKNEDFTASLPEIPSELAAADPGSPYFSWMEEDIAALLDGRPALC